MPKQGSPGLKCAQSVKTDGNASPARKKHSVRVNAFPATHFNIAQTRKQSRADWGCHFGDTAPQCRRK